jgi:acyl carrier protein
MAMKTRWTTSNRDFWPRPAVEHGEIDRRRKMHAEIEALLLELIASACGADVQALNADTPLVDIDLDSLSLVSIVGQLEAAYRVSIGGHATASILEASTIGDLSTAIASQIEDARIKAV